METALDRITKLCNGNADAVDFLCRWAMLADKVDNIIDGDAPGPEPIMSAFADCIVLTSHPFYLQNLPALRAVVLVAINIYADSVAWENSDLEWKRRFADCYRHGGNEVVNAVAQICGGFDHARAFSLEQREICHATQHPEGKE